MITNRQFKVAAGIALVLAIGSACLFSLVTTFSADDDSRHRNSIDTPVRPAPNGETASERVIDPAPVVSKRAQAPTGDATPESMRVYYEIVGLILINAAALTLMLGLMAYYSRRSRHRIEIMKSTLAAFTAGDIDRRIQFPGPVDNLSDLARAINASLEHTKILAESLNHTSSDIAHNLKKPMTRLRQRLELVSSCDSGGAEFKRKIGEALEDIDSLVAKFEALLNIGQMRLGDHRARFVNVDVTALIAHIVEIYEPIVADSGHSLETDLPATPVILRGDRELLMEMFVNFIENSILHCPAGTHISIALKRVKTGISAVIADNGQGVPRSEIENVFQRFYRLDASRATPGHGLGVPCSVAIAELHGAVIDLLDNRPGLRVVIHFPVNPFNETPQLGLRMRSGLRLSFISDNE